MYRLMQLIRKIVGFFLDLSGIMRAGLRIDEDRIQYYEAWRGLRGFKVRKFIEEHDFNPENLEFSLSRLFQKKGGILPYSVTTTLEGKGVIAKIITIPRVPRQKIGNSILWEIRKYLPTDPGQVVVDWQILGSTEEEGRPSWNVLFVAAKRSEVERTLEVVGSFRIHTRAVRYLPLSFVNSYKKNTMETSIAYVSFTEQMVCISILEKERLLLANTSFLKGRKALNRHVMEVLKKFIEERVSFLERVVVFGGDPPLLEEITDELNILALPVSDEDLVTPLPPGFYEGDKIPFLFGTLRSTPVNINLMPEERRSVNKRRRLIAIVILGASFLFASLIGFYFNMRYEIGSLDPAKVRNLDWVKRFDKQIKGIEAEMRQLDRIRRYGSAWSRRLAGVASIIGQRRLYGKVWLRRITSDQRGRGLIEGVALSNSGVTAFLGGLEKFPLLSGVAIAFIRPLVIQKRDCVRFRITFQLKGGGYGN